MAKKIDITKHSLVPKHNLVSEAEKKKISDTLKLSGKELPKILKTDPAIKNIKIKDGDIIKITRKSPTAGETIFYRRVVSN
ncbi:DNA-directed RNA polymerase subunit H [Candidatus Woesearchaeota archaeon]|nr:DNA-directed RNA polymerase subunit H [Candidatus Woesearchaeota archaeon]MBW2978574.1 DNA-directed RNA polymerase subunit H [Candidatus Woesearchaeota archaeon]